MATVLIYWFVLLATASTALATASTSTLLDVCTTKYGRTSTSRVSTQNVFLTVTSHATLTTTSTPIKASTFSPSTITSVVTDTVYSTSVLDQNTDTFSTSLTLTSVVTTYDTITNTQTITTDTTFTSSTTTTILPSSGFTFASALSQSTNGPRQTAAAEQGAATHGALTLNASIHSSQAGALVVVNPPIYPTAVTCAGIVRVITTSTITKTAATSTVTSTPSAKTTTVTTESTSTITSTPVAASVTLTFSRSTTVSTLTTSTTTTQTITDTVTVDIPIATYYAACGPDNQVSEINGLIINQVSLVSDGMFGSQPVTNAYDCCVGCLTYSGICTGYVFLANDQCLLNLPSNIPCDPSENTFEKAGFGNGTNGFTIGNSNCGSYSVL